MDQAFLDILKEAVATRQRKEELDRSIGRAVRRHQLGFGAFIQLMSELREVARENKTTIEEAAKSLLADKE